MIPRAIAVCCIASFLADFSAVAAEPPKGDTVGDATATMDTATSKRHAAKRPKYHVNFQPAGKKSTDVFQGITQSMPAAAVKEELVRKNEMPSAQTSVLTPGAAAGTSTAPVAGHSEAPPAASGAAPNILSPGKVAEPESKTLEN